MSRLVKATSVSSCGGGASGGGSPLPGRSAVTFNGSNGGTLAANWVGVVVSVVDSSV